MSKAQARYLRKAATDAEARLWSHLRNRNPDGKKFRRQVPIGKYFAEFVCFEHRLIVEVDGSQHHGSTHDEVRDAWLRSQGYSVLRFWNDDVLSNIDTVLTEIAMALGTEPCPDADE